MSSKTHSTSTFSLLMVLLLVADLIEDYSMGLVAMFVVDKRGLHIYAPYNWFPVWLVQYCCKRDKISK